ncbi:FAD-binding oxidoreductase [Maritimibacter sp. DP1N21-5]|uniref:FAD-binding oxidoreductase n=1 Tax=Maritimibacter sp. DP1N21-5 TaxID=2836867 RepID=UPI001C44DC64|nr:FAD-binding oxidoreductase [Maritimibacter sp. DP1N21-5]MBV7409319.1 FAD-binding oxidoreductase [Maritimibacter sp. DP1N21-5]
MTLNPADTDFATHLRDDLPDAVFRPLEPRFLEEPRGLFRGQSGLVLAPRSTDEVATIVRACHRARVGIVPYGGGTGLVGGQVMPEGPAPVILTLDRMTRIRDVFPAENVLVAEAGAILAEVQRAAAEADRLFPLSLASEGSARMGGLLATNAGGVNVLRYGNTRDLVLGIEAVLPDGSIWNGLRRLRKDNTGYDLRGLLIGAEGTLGIITAAALRLFPRLVEAGTALFTVPDPDAALGLLALAGARIGQGISAFELISGQGPRFLIETDCPGRCPLDPIPEWMVLVDLGFAAGTEAQAALADLFEAAFDAGLASDGVVATSEAQRHALWAMREDIPQANRRVGAVSSHDISVPLSLIPEFLRWADARVREIGPFRINAFGHLGDGNLHYNIFPPAGEPRELYAGRRQEVADAVYALVHEMGGSFSAEHGIGRLKTGDLARFADPAKLTAMRAIKSALDPQGIMNPGVIFPA